MADESTPHRHCAAFTAGGQPCGAGPQRDRAFCFVHDPERAAEADEARRLGGLRRRRESTVAAAYDLSGLDTLDGMRRLLEIAVTDTLSLEVGEARIRVLLAAIAVARRIHSDADVERRLEVLEGVIRAGRDAHPPEGLLGAPGR
jgi:hypothetical protein